MRSQRLRDSSDQRSTAVREAATLIEASTIVNEDEEEGRGREWSVSSDWNRNSQKSLGSSEKRVLEEPMYVQR
jgi:hypothetical protein